MSWIFYRSYAKNYATRQHIFSDFIIFHGIEESFSYVVHEIMRWFFFSSLHEQFQGPNICVLYCRSTVWRASTTTAIFCCPRPPLITLHMFARICILHHQNLSIGFGCSRSSSGILFINMTSCGSRHVCPVSGSGSGNYLVAYSSSIHHLLIK